MVLRCGEAAGRVGSWGMLYVFAMLRDESRGQPEERSPQLRDKLFANQVLDGLFFFRLRVDVYIKLRIVSNLHR